ncbi:MAG TPA: right-handed parallel beta-helix repeat-containing protein [Verrucomicrobiae bacterium]|nr:right-handed parallel beta-helix repeat-containing protein [Verrucomicrobiae bacterium]
MVRRPVSDTIQIKKGISRGRRLLERATLAFVLAGCLLVQFAFADGLITVTNADDAGPGTLRQAIADSVADDTIAIALNADDTIALTSGELLITNDLTIVSSNATIAIDAGGNSRVLEIGSSNSVILDSLIITNGNVPDSGGGILVNDGGTLTLTNCIVTGNFAGGGGGIYVSSNSSVALNNCIFSANSAEDGGAIANIGSVLIATRLSVSNNSARAGGGIFNANNNSILTLNDSIFAGNLATNFGGGLINTNGGTVTINNSTFSSNACPADNGGGIDNWSTITLNNCTISGSPSGGGFVNTGGAAVCNNSTFSGNVAIFDGGGYYASAGSNILNNCTISGNSALRRAGGLYENSTLSFLTNTIIAGNTSATTYPNFSGTFSGVNNLVDVDPLLAPLGNYGGPTQTMPPLGGSRCINAGVDSVTNLLTTDQRGVPRLAGSHVDIGAVEIQPAIVMNTNDDGPGSLRAIASLAPELIAFANALSGQTIRLTSGPLTLSNSVGIDASHLAGGILIDPGGASRVLEISSNTIVTLDSLVITNGNVSDTGGGILVDDGVNLTITNCTVAGNSAGDGGGIFIFSNSTVAINNSTFNGNSATNGGAIDSDTTSTLTLNNSTVAYNTAIQSGGGIAVPAGVTNTLNNCTVSGNSAGNGGGVFQDPDSVSVLDNTIVAGNTAPSAADIAGPFTGSNNLTNGNPLLAPLGNYGGPTQTMLPLAGSAAIDAGLDTAAPSLIIDQRGYPRQSGAHVDIGAVEAQWAPANDRPVVRLGRVPSGGAWQITFTNLPTADFTVLASTNVALPRNQWDVLGPATQNPPGIFQFTDSTATNSKARFYQVVSP